MKWPKDLRKALDSLYIWKSESKSSYSLSDYKLLALTSAWLLYPYSFLTVFVLVRLQDDPCWWFDLIGLEFHMLFLTDIVIKVYSRTDCMNYSYITVVLLCRSSCYWLRSNLFVEFKPGVDPGGGGGQGAQGPPLEIENPGSNPASGLRPVKR